ncbi:MAG TPA: DUF5680 domain-containing protein [Anaerolineales bacterium]|nr:DUF5680 domain-containing protein [Anaerolineales bacterium]
MEININELNDFIVRAKAATYVGDGERVAACRAGSHDLRFTNGEWAYHDSYFGGTDFIGEEVVYFAEKPIWAMNYYGRILRADLLSAAQAGQMIKASLSRLYQHGRFLGGFEHAENDLTYVDASEGRADCFQGREVIRRGQEIAYELVYHGGLIRD